MSAFQELPGSALDSVVADENQTESRVEQVAAQANPLSPKLKSTEAMAKLVEAYSDPAFEFLHPIVREWFAERFGSPTPAQREGWPAIASGQHTLIAAPTGSGKTLAAFLVTLDRLVRRWLGGQLRDEIDTVYISPLRALSNDIDRNLQQPLEEIAAVAAKAGLGKLPIRTGLRTGDTTPSQRQSMLRRPPHVLVTTPESLYLLLTSAKGREKLRSTQTVIVDEIHALARDKRGSHLALSLERLEHVARQPLTRIGLSATQKPIDQIASFLVGVGNQDKPNVGDSSSTTVAISSLAQCEEGVEIACSEERDRQGLFPPPACSLVPLTSPDDPDSKECVIVDAGHVRELDVAIDVPIEELAAVCSHEQWEAVYGRLLELIETHRSTLVFVNTRRLAERVAHGLRERLGEEAVASHHGSLAKELRLDAEQRLKNGELKAIVATASLELGIDIGLIDLVCQVGSPRSIATFLQRIGRSGHSVGAIPKGRLFPLTRDELLESMALTRAVRAQRLDAVEIPVQPLDILAQQIIAETAAEDWSEEGLYHLVRQAWPYRRLTRLEYRQIVEMVSEGVNKSNGKGAYVHRDRINGVLKGRRGARLAATQSGGAIPETAEYRVVTEDEKVVVGSVDEDFAIDSTVGSIFLLGNNSWRVVGLRGSDMVVQDAQGQPPNIPFWFGEAPGRTIELSQEVSQIREVIATRLTHQHDRSEDSADESHWITTDVTHGFQVSDELTKWLAEETGTTQEAAEQAAWYVAAQLAAVGMVPTQKKILFERFFDESGGTQLVIHAPLGTRVTRAWGLSLRKRFCRSFDFELQAAADDNGVVLSLGPQHSLPIEQLFGMLLPENGQYLLEQAMLAVPYFQIRWRWNVTRALGVMRRHNGKKVPPHLQRFRAEDLLASAFPETVGCLENHHGDVQIPDHPLVIQTMRDCLFEATDIVQFVELLSDIKDGKIELLARDSTEPSPFSHELLNANPYAFLDDAPLEERRSRAVATRRTLSPEQMRDLGQLDPDAVKTVRQQAWPLIRDKDELHDALLSLVILDELDAGPWLPWLNELAAVGRASLATIPLACDDELDKGSNVSEVDAQEANITSSNVLKSADSEKGQTSRYWFASENWPLLKAAFAEATASPEVNLPEELSEEVSRSHARVALVRGFLSYAGPTTVEEISASRQIASHHVQSALESLEGEGTAMRGHYTDELAGRGTRSENGAPLLQWCDRRLLARIHQLTINGLRQQIEPVTVATYYRFLLSEHQLIGDRSWSGPVGLREMVSKLQGFDLSAGAWEEQVLAPRLDAYDSSWLDGLFLSGDVMWGRIAPPRPTKKSEEQICSGELPSSILDRSLAAEGMRAKPSLNRLAPLAIVLRSDLPWILPTHRSVQPPGELTTAARILDELRIGGAQFTQELAMLCRSDVSELLTVLRELAASGLITGDSFGIVREAVSRRISKGGRTKRRGSSRSSAPAAGRWSLFPPRLPEVSREERVEAWCRLLLNRYGIVFRELLTRETAAPRWYELQTFYRRMEMRGEIRGGRFVTGVGGEQFASADAVKRVRELRNVSPDEDGTVISAADPLNLVGILDKYQRVPASPKNAILVRGGKVIAVRLGVNIEFLEEVEQVQQGKDRQQLLQFGIPSRRPAARRTRKLRL